MQGKIARRCRIDVNCQYEYIKFLSTSTALTSGVDIRPQPSSMLIVIQIEFGVQWVSNCSRSICV